MRIGFAGLGRMGANMARRLAEAGFDLTVWNRSSDKAQKLVDECGCKIAETPADLTRKTDIVIAMLADDQASEQVHNGPNGLFSTTGASIFVEMGTMRPDHIHALALSAPAGAMVMDAPVSGATLAAQTGQLMIMAGCSDVAIAPLIPVFDVLGKKVICLGDKGAGFVMKLVINSLIHGINQTMAEAMTLAEAASIDNNLAFDAIESSAACAPMLKYRRALYLDEQNNDVTFTVALARKDMEITAELARGFGVAMPQGGVTLDKLKEAEKKGFADRDMASILNFMREENQ